MSKIKKRLWVKQLNEEGFVIRDQETWKHREFQVVAATGVLFPPLGAKVTLEAIQELIAEDVEVNINNEL